MDANNLITLLQAKEAVGRALPLAQQHFVSASVPTLVSFLCSELGQLACREFVAHWQNHVDKGAAAPLS